MFKETFYKLVTDMLRLSVAIITQISENYSVIARLKFFYLSVLRIFGETQL